MLFRSVLFNLPIFGDFTALSVIDSSLIPLWSESNHCMSSIFLNLLMCVLWPRLWSILVNIPHELEKNGCVLLLLGAAVCKCPLYPVTDFLPAENVHF